ncbi:hypothetical protein ACFQY4_04880 [Catellatospora bangladeshensis]|uniref:hypothetical protein n=1 Tax=Catellatospora bangladeshensis TaxID=310355 RepID=UPI00361262AE
MSKHRLREDDETTLLPRAVEEPAAAEPVAEDHPERPSRRAPVVIAVVTTGLLLSGAAAWALAKPAPNAPTVALPEILASTPGAGFVDGFGVVTPSPTHLASLAPAQPPASPTATSGASASAGPSPAVPSPSRTTVGAPPERPHRVERRSPGCTTPTPGRAGTWSACRCATRAVSRCSGRCGSSCPRAPP